MCECVCVSVCICVCVLQAYDDQTLAATTDEKEKRKFEVESNQAKKLLTDLKERVKKTKAKVFSDTTNTRMYTRHNELPRAYTHAYYYIYIYIIIFQIRMM